ncbi:MAG: thioredoxin family protein [Calditrichaeota bacterium]|nr:MAG: thioredoxin family protein [Calditrichota bacterium]
MIVKVLGAGCTKCKTLEQQLIALKTKHELNFDIEKITQLNDIIAYGVMMTPALVIDEEVKAVGKIPKNEEILNWLHDAESVTK